MISGLHQHHIGCLVESIDSFKADNESTWGWASYSQIHTVSTQDVKVCFLQFSSDTVIELVEPGPENQALSRMIQKGTTFYHIGFITDSFAKSIEKLINTGFRMVNEFESEAFGGKRCAFLFHPQLHLIELIEGGRPKTS